MSTSPTPTQPMPLTLSVEEAAAALGVGRTTLYGAIRNGSFPALRIGGRVVVSRIAIERLLAGDESKPVSTDR